MAKKRKRVYKPSKQHAKAFSSAPKAPTKKPDTVKTDWDDIPDYIENPIIKDPPSENGVSRETPKMDRRVVISALAILLLVLLFSLFLLW